MTEDAIAPLAPADLTLDELRAALAPLVAANAAFDGWSDKAVEAAARTFGADADVARLAYGGSAVEMIDAWFGEIDRRMMEAVSADALAAMKIRERITALVEARLAAVAGEREALRRALAILAMPRNVARATKLGWRTVDLMWRLAATRRPITTIIPSGRCWARSMARRSRCSSTTKAAAMPIPARSWRGGSTGSCGSRR